MIARPHFRLKIFEDLLRAGVHAPCVQEVDGGLGLGPGSDTFVLWMMTKELARADMSLGRCWEGHVNSQGQVAWLPTTAG